jgi:triosephosphate isomerase (TIM)
VAHIFVNLKRFEVSRKLGGLCSLDSPPEWIKGVIAECAKLGVGRTKGIEVTFLLPEALIIPAMETLKNCDSKDIKNIGIGCQSVFRDDIKPGKNFGAFTANLPATAAKVIGCDWSMIGHSEERKDKAGIIGEFLSSHSSFEAPPGAIADAVSRLVNKETLCALDAGLKVLVCVGESAEERGTGDWAEQQQRVKDVLKRQLAVSLQNTQESTKDNRREIVVGYEPIWAIGPGKTPPDSQYISFVASYIKKAATELFGYEPKVVYGGGLKEENAAAIAGIPAIGGGLVALTRFSGEIGFYPEDLRKIIDAYVK